MPERERITCASVGESRRPKGRVPHRTQKSGYKPFTIWRLPRPAVSLNNALRRPLNGLDNFEPRRPKNCIEAVNSPFERNLRNSTNGPFRKISSNPYI